jgi:hypothetical protein
MLNSQQINPCSSNISNPVLYRKYANIDSLNLIAACKYCFSLLPQEVKQCIHQVCSQPSEPFIHNKRKSLRDFILSFVQQIKRVDGAAFRLVERDVHDILNAVHTRLASSMSVASLIDADLRKETYEEKWFGIPSTDFLTIRTIIAWQSRVRDRLTRQSSRGGWYSRMLASRVSVAQLI